MRITLKRKSRADRAERRQITFCEACGRVCDASCLAERTYRLHRDGALLATSRKIV